MYIINCVRKIIYMNIIELLERKLLVVIKNSIYRALHVRYVNLYNIVV